MPDARAAIADPAVRAAYREWLLRIADDELVIGHRHSEWTGFGPDIESDVAMSSIAQEELGHGRAWYEQIAADDGGDVDRLAFGRAPREYRHAALLEQENDGWEYSIVRLVLYEAFEVARLRLVAASGHEPAAGLAQTLSREERYHGLFADTWLTRLAGAPDGLERVQAALDRAWPDALGLFESTAADDVLRRAGVLPSSPGALRETWVDTVRPVLEQCGLAVPPSAGAREGGRRGVHTAAFEPLLVQLTEVWKSDPEARW